MKYKEVYFEDSQFLVGWCFYDSENIFIIKNQEVEESRIIDFVLEDLKRNNELPEGFNLIVAEELNIYNFGTFALEEE